LTRTVGQIEPRLSLFDTMMIVVSLVIGIGIFRTPALVAANTGTAPKFLAAWVLGGVINLIGALTFAEIGSRAPRAGGYYKVAAECWSPVAAFMLNWAQVVMQGVGATGVAFIGAEYLLRFVQAASGSAPAAFSPAAVPWTAAALLAGLLAINFAGIRAGARLQNVLSIAKGVMILGLAAAAFTLAPRAEPGAAAVGPAITNHGFLAALVAVFYTYGGYQCTMNVAGDVRDARRNLPRAVTLGMVIVTLLYVGINAGYMHALGPAGVAAEKLVAAGLARVCFGTAGEAVISVAIFLSAAGFVNATILQVPRSYLAMAQDGALPAAFARVNPRTQAQTVGLAFLGFTSLIAVPFLGSFDKLVGYVMFTDSLMVAAVAACIFVLRRRAGKTATSQAEPAAVFRMPGYPWLPGLFVACLTGLAVQIAITQTRLALAGTGVLLVGFPLYHALRRTSRTA